MRYTLCLLLVLTIRDAAYAQDSMSVFGSVIFFAHPNHAHWALVHQGMDSTTNKYLIMYKHVPINDAEGRPIEPVVALLCEEITDPIEIISYSLWKRQQVPFTPKRILSKFTNALSYWNAIGYEGEYTREDIQHKLLIAHYRHKRVGVSLICDSTEGVYKEVEADMRAFIKSVNLSN
jgi:hypothetical protein